jgi:hypothetical protein
MPCCKHTARPILLLFAANRHIAGVSAGSTAAEGFGKKHGAIVVVVSAAVVIELSGVRYKSEHGSRAAAAVKIEKRALLHGIPSCVSQ